MGGADFEIFLLMVAPLTDFVFFDVRENFVARVGKVEDPSMGGIEVVRFDKTVVLEGSRLNKSGGFNANKKGVFGGGELFEGGERVFEGGEGILLVEGRTVGAV